MFDIYLAIDLVIIVALLLLAAAVLSQNRRTELNRVFALSAVSVTIWISANYISNDTTRSPDAALFANHFVFFFSYLTAISILHLTVLLTHSARAHRVLMYSYPVVLLVGGMSFTPLIPAGVELQNNVYAVIFGPGIGVYGLFLLGAIVAIFYLLITSRKHLRGQTRQRVSVLLKTFSVSLPLLLVMLFILPVATGWFGLTNIGILPMAAFVAGVYVAVFKHQLFDLRAVVIRSFAYIFTIGIILSFYAVFSYEAARYLTSGPNDEGTRNFINAVLIILAAVSFGPTRKYFNRITSKIFYRDTYDSQELLTKVNQVIVSKNELGKLSTETLAIIEEYLKPGFATIALTKTSYRMERQMGSRQIRIDNNDLDGLERHTLKMGHGVIIATDLPESNKLRHFLNERDIAVMVKLTTTLKGGSRAMGYLLLGHKKSGVTYNKSDIENIRIITGELAVAIENALRFEEIQQFNATLQDKIAEATRKMRRSNERLKALDEAKDDFVSMASHQLRTPLTSIKGYISMVLEGDAGEINDIQRKLLEQSFASSQRMVFLIADLLNVSRLKTGKFVIEEMPVNLAETVGSEIEQLQTTAAGRQLTLKYEQPKVFPTMLLDENKTRQVIMNLVDNAIYYTPAGGTVEVSVKETASAVEFRVKDNGIGVPRSERPHLFTKFYRAGNARKARPDGTGLGLFMAKKVVVSQGGSIIFETEEGKGSTFGFIFPKSKMVPGTTQAVKA